MANLGAGASRGASGEGGARGGEVGGGRGRGPRVRGGREGWTRQVNRGERLGGRRNGKIGRKGEMKDDEWSAVLCCVPLKRREGYIGLHAWGGDWLNSGSYTEGGS